MKRTILSLFAVGLLAACSNTGPGAQVSLSFSGGASVSSPNPGIFSAADPLFDGTNTLTIETAEIVLRRIKLKRLEAGNCDLDSEAAGCEDFVTDAQLISLPTDGTTSDKTFAIQVAEGTYTDVEFDVHKVSADDQEDRQFREDHPDHVGLSIKVVGTYNGEMFTYITDLNDRQEVALSEQIVVENGVASKDVTIVLNLDTWFRDAQDNLIDPDTALKGGINENLVKNNIRASIDAF